MISTTKLEREVNRINAAAEPEGWALFVAGGVFEIERDDESAVFESDEAAVAHVERLALSGAWYALRALELHGTEVLI